MDVLVNIHCLEELSDLLISLVFQYLINPNIGILRALFYHLPYKLLGNLFLN